MFWVYILQNPKGQLYIGHTDHLENRILSHKSNRQDQRKVYAEKWAVDFSLVGRTSRSVEAPCAASAKLRTGNLRA
jgi:predicted GIY-YIG superfamily endonuclease